MARALGAARVSGLLSQCGAAMGMIPGVLDTAPNCARAGTQLLRRSAVSTTPRSGDYSSADYPPHYLLSMPSLSPLMTEGRIVEWKVSEGAQVDAFDLVCDIETESLTEREDETLTLEVESQEDAYLAKVLVPAGKTVPVGAPIAVFAQREADCKSFSTYTPEQVGEVGNADPFFWQAYVKGHGNLDM